MASLDGLRSWRLKNTWLLFRKLRMNKKQTAGVSMLPNSLFTDMTLQNRLGQDVHLGVYHVSYQGRDYVFVMAPLQQASSFVGKNAEPFAFQLREKFAVEARRFEFIEVRERLGMAQLYRWRFEWVGNSPLSAKSEEITSAGLRAVLLSLIAPQNTAGVASA